MSNTEKFYATFGFSHQYAGHVVEIIADSRSEAEEKMFDSRHGRRWAFMYDSLADVHPDDRRKGILETLE